MSVFGRKKWTFVRFLDTLRATDCLTAFATLAAFLPLPDFSAPAASAATVFSFFGAMGAIRTD